MIFWPFEDFARLDIRVWSQHRAKKYNIARNHGIMGLKKSSSKNDKF